MEFYSIIAGIFFIIFGASLIIFNTKFTSFKIKQTQKFLNRKKKKRYDNLFKSKDYFYRQRIQYYGVASCFILAGAYALLWGYGFVTNQIKIVFFFFLVLIGVVSISLYYKIKRE